MQTRDVAEFHWILLLHIVVPSRNVADASSDAKLRPRTVTGAPETAMLYGWSCVSVGAS